MKIEEILANIEHFDKLLDERRVAGKLIHPDAVQEFLARLTMKLKQL